MTQLTDEDVAMMRMRRAEGWSQGQIARHFDVSIGHVGRVLRNEVRRPKNGVGVKSFEALSKELNETVDWKGLAELSKQVAEKGPIEAAQENKPALTDRAKVYGAQETSVPPKTQIAKPPPIDLTKLLVSPEIVCAHCSKVVEETAGMKREREARGDKPVCSFECNQALGQTG